MFNGHYDAVVATPNLDNPEFLAWCKQRGQDDYASEILARQLQVQCCLVQCGIAGVEGLTNPWHRPPPREVGLG